MRPPRLRFPTGFEVNFSDDGAWMVCVGRNVVVIDVARRQRAWTSHPVSHPSKAAFSPDGGKLAVKSTSGRIVVLGAQTGAVLHDHGNQREGEGSQVCFSADSDQLVDGSWEGVLTVRDAIGGMVRSQKVSAGEMIPRVSHDRNRRTWLFEYSPTVRAGENSLPPGYLVLQSWPFADDSAQTFSFGFRIAEAMLSPDGRRVCLIEKPAYRLIIVDTSDGAVRATGEPFAHGGTGNEIAWSTDSRFVASVQHEVIVFYRAADLTEMGRVVSEYPASACFHPDGNRVGLGTWTTSAIVTLDQVFANNLAL